MTISLKNYTKVLPAGLLKQADKEIIRECDETEKGHFVAYVDEGKETYDVSLTVSPQNEITAHSCDCKNNSSFCKHKAALLVHVAKGKKIKTTISKTKTKTNKIEDLLEEATPEDLKDWIRNTLQKNKDLEFSFTYYFSSKQQKSTPSDVTKITNDAIKVVAGNKKNIDQTQLKKIVDLWTELHTPIVQSYLANAGEESAFKNFHTILKTALLFQLKIRNYNSSNKILEYVEGLLQSAVDSINNFQNEDSWLKAIRFFIDHSNDENGLFNLGYLHHLRNIIGISNEERKNKIISLLAKYYKESLAKEFTEHKNYTECLLTTIVENKLFHEYYDLFKPIKYENQFNQILIRLLIDNNHLARAEKYCKEQMQGNYDKKYNIPYLILLNQIYTAQNDKVNLIKIKEELLPVTFDFDDYLYLYDQIGSEEEKKKWRNKFLAKASHSYNLESTIFCFRLMAHENSYKKMIQYINSFTPYTLILEFFEPMARTDKDMLLLEIIKKSEAFHYTFINGDEEINDNEIYPELYNAVLKYYDPYELQVMLHKMEKDRHYYRRNNFMLYLKNRLHEEAS